MSICHHGCVVGSTASDPNSFRIAASFEEGFEVRALYPSILCFAHDVSLQLPHPHVSCSCWISGHGQLEQQIEGTRFSRVSERSSEP